METWKDVVGYEGLYEVSDSGIIRTHKDKTTFTQWHGNRKWKQRILKDKTPNGRDARVTLWKSGKSKDFLIHRLVAEAFIPKIAGKDFVNHKDGNPKNNQVSNLEWCNHKENNNHAFDNELIKTSKKVILINRTTQEPFYFRSMGKASEFLGRNVGYISSLIQKGIHEIDDYEIFTKG